ncbi:MAG: transglycosylase domain-containing protein [bacterium]
MRGLFLKRKFLTITSVVCVCSITFFIILSLALSVQPLPDSLRTLTKGPLHANILDRNGNVVSSTKQNALNNNPLPIWKMPELLIEAFLYAEDKRFLHHRGIDWLARVNAIIDNLKAGKITRGASTITEQCIRIIHPRPRTFYTRWIETIEAYLLESKFSKDEIVEFYLNQVPFSHQCRGVSQAADLYFGRSLDTLNEEELLSLAVLVRAPSFFSNPKNKKELHKRIALLAARMNRAHLISAHTLNDTALFATTADSPIYGAPHFIQFLKNNYENMLTSEPRILTTINSHFQHRYHHLLKETLKRLQGKNVHNAALLVLDHQTDEILAWVNGNDFFSSKEGSQIDAVLALRQPGSVLKPFLYAHALEEGFTPSTIVPDIPVAQPVGHGLHHFKNYSNINYGPVRLRCALGNSLNIPAVRVLEHIGMSRFFTTLKDLGIESLSKNSAHYGIGLALGNGEVSLFELVRAYGVLARGGIYREPRFFLHSYEHGKEQRIFSEEVCSLIAHILSDPYARILEFGGSGLLDFPVQTAVKTGTSNDYRDSWAIGFNYHYTVGVWMGNLDYEPTMEITGSRGPALILRAVFNELNKYQDTQPLFFSRTLKSRQICALSGALVSSSCPYIITEWYRKDHMPAEACNWHQKKDGILYTTLPYLYHEWMRTHEDALELLVTISPDEHLLLNGNDSEADDQEHKERRGELVRMIQPVPHLHLATDPRIPDELEKFPFIIETAHPIEKIKWYLNDILLCTTGPDINHYLWNPQRGEYHLHAQVKLKDIGKECEISKVAFRVK